MPLRSKSELDDGLVGRPLRLPVPARDIVAAALLTLAAAVFIGAAFTARPAPESPRIEAAAGNR